MPTFERNGLTKSRTTPDFEVINEGEQLGRGLSEGVVEAVDINLIKNKRRRSLTMARKTFDVEQEEANKRDSINRILSIHSRLKSRHIPTIPTMRRVQNDNSVIYMTDLTIGGAKHVVSLPDWGIGQEHRGKFFGTDKNFTISNPEQVMNDLLNIFELIVASDCIIDYPDAFFMTIDKQTNSANVILGDLLDISFIETKSLGDKKRIIDENFEVFMSFIRDIKKHINSEPPLSVSTLLGKRSELRTKYLGG